MTDPSVAGVRPNLLGISGSIRAASYCTAVLVAMQDLIAARATMTMFSLAEIPPYNEDEEGEREPPSVRGLKAAIEQADGLIVISPEYNHGMSGVLKNAVDWASRPGYESVLVDKPILLMTASPTRFGGVRAHVQLLETFVSTLSRVLARRQIAIQQVDRKIENGRLTDEGTRKQLSDGLDALLREIALLRSSRGD
jgi:chromate reductase